MIADYPFMCSLLIIKGRQRSRELFGKDVREIITPYNKMQIEHLIQNNDDWIIALQGYTGQILFHYPRHPLVEFTKNVELIFPRLCSPDPLSGALTVFTDGSSSGRAMVFVEGQEPLVEEGERTSAQQAEIKAVILAFKTFPQKVNLYSDSKYVINLFPAIETALLSGNSTILPLLKRLQTLIHQRSKIFFIGHIRGHTNLPGPLAHGNAMADLLTKTVVSTVVEAEKCHALHHQNALALKRMFNLTREQARQIVKNCSNCPQTYHPLKLGVNPRGLKTNVLWQMDVTHIPSFGKLSYVHVTIDTFSHLVFASARTGEAVKDVVQHMSQCFAVMGKPFQLKTNNGPTYASKTFKIFCLQWKISHSTEIPYNPQGQAIIERAHQTLKNQIERLQSANTYFTPHHLLSHALFVINHLNTNERGKTPAMVHWTTEINSSLPQVLWKDLLSGK